MMQKAQLIRSHISRSVLARALPLVAVALLGTVSGCSQEAGNDVEDPGPVFDGSRQRARDIAIERERDDTVAAGEPDRRASHQGRESPRRDSLEPRPLAQGREDRAPVIVRLPIFFYK